MKLSIIVPVYNAEKYLSRCLDSLVCQTLDDYEIIIINDGSTDMSQKIIDRYMSDNFGRILSINIDNGGQGRARNIGLDAARGEYIGFADSDDWVDAAMFEKMYALAKESNADIVLCDTIKCYADGKEEYDDTSTFSDPLEISAAVWNKLFRKSLLSSIRFPEKLWYEDLPFITKSVLSAEKIVGLHEALYYYRIGQASTTNNNNALKNLDVITSAEETRKFMESKGDYEGFRYILINHVLIDSISRLTAQPKTPERQRVIKQIRAYVKKYVPQLTSCESYKKEKPGRRAAMFFNYYGMEELSRFLVRIKKMLCKQ